MSCLDVMYHQSYGAHYLPAAAYKATYYNHHHQQQQRKLGVYSKMQECSRPSSDSESKDGTQPTETEYLSSRCVLFTYFQGNIGDVVDEHFSRALSQSSTFSGENNICVSLLNLCDVVISDGGSLSESQGSSAWNSAYPSQNNSCVHSVSVSVHPGFSSSPVSFNHQDGALWAGHMLSQASLSPAATLPDSWTYSLNPQNTSGYPNVHDVYHPHIHTRHHHPMLHTYPTHSPALDPRFNSLLLPGVRSQNQPSTNTGSSPHSEVVKAEIDPSSNNNITATSVTWTPSALDQTKAKTSVWF
uniref:Vestigial like family member 3 n=1 Tax=Amphilophus citrinellus TaxID=61819 RepID=A0A3Q0QUE7_AMPCI